MKIHRFYYPDAVSSDVEVIYNKELLHQWSKVLRFKAGQQLVLFDGKRSEKLFELRAINHSQATLISLRDEPRIVPKKEVYLLWSLLKKDKNDWILQKSTELGASHLIPLVADRSEKTGFKIDRARKIVIEASEQCGRSDIPKVYDPLTIEEAINIYSSKTRLLIAEKTETTQRDIEKDIDSIGIMIGPEGGWSEKEKALFLNKKLLQINLHSFTLRAETAAIIAVLELLQ